MQETNISMILYILSVDIALKVAIFKLSHCKPWCTMTLRRLTLVYGPGCLANVDDSMTINRISIGKRTLMFSFSSLISMY